MLYQEYAEYEPTFKIWLGTNHRPVIRETTLAMWRRVRLIPFNVTITEAEKDPEIAAKLLLEAPGILAWAVRGCLEWQKHGLGMAEDVRKATAEYRAESDEVGRFIEDRCVVGEDKWVQATELYRLYQAWAESEGIKAMSQRAFGVRLNESGKEQDKRTRKRGWSGLAPRDESGTDGDGSMPFSGKSPREISIGDFTANSLQSVPAAPNPSPNPLITPNNIVQTGKSVSPQPHSAASPPDAASDGWEVV
jgi:putative DNA primase/helicase